MSDIDQLIEQGDRILAEFNATYNRCSIAQYSEGDRVLHIPDIQAYFEWWERVLESEQNRRKGIISGTSPMNPPVPIEAPLMDEDITDDSEYDTKGFSITRRILRGIRDALHSTLSKEAMEGYQNGNVDFIYTDAIYEFGSNLFNWDGFPGVGVLLPAWDSRPTFQVYERDNPSSVFVVGLPDGIQDWINKALACLKEAHKVPYEPDVDRRPEWLTYAYCAAAHAIFLRQCEPSYSEGSITAFQESFKAYLSVYKSIGPGRNHPDMGLELEDAPYFPEDQMGVQVLVGLHLFNISVLDRKWQDALRMYAHAIACFGLIARTRHEMHIYIDEPEGYQATVEYFASHDPLVSYWKQSEEDLHKEAKSVFDHIRDLSMPIGDESWKEISTYVQSIIKSIESYWWVDPELQHLPCWTGALWWLRGAKLDPGELRDELIRERRREDDERAQQRLTRYFFTTEQWVALSQRAKEALVDADRLRFSHRWGTSDAPIIHLQMAAEDLIRDLFDCELAGFENKLKLKDLKTDGFDKDEESFIKKQLPSDLKRLKCNRNLAVHSSGKPVLAQQEEVAALFNTFMGIGCEGILPRLANLKLKLFPAKPSAKL